MDFLKYFPKYRKKREENQRSTVAYLQRQRTFYYRNSLQLDAIYNKIGVDIGSGINFKVIKIDTTGTGDKWTEFTSTNSDLMRVLTLSPNELETPTVFWSSVTRKLVEESIAVVIPTYDNAGNIDTLTLAKRVVSLSPKTVTIVLDDDSQQLTIDLSSVWLFENPKKDLSLQLGQLTALINSNLTALSEKLADAAQGIKGFIKTETIAADSAMVTKMEERVKNIQTVASSGGIGYLNAGEEFIELSGEYSTASASEVEYLKSQLYSAFGLSEAVFTGNYTEAQYRAYYQSVLEPIIRVYTEEITRKYFTKSALTQGKKLLVQMDLIKISNLTDLTDFITKAGYVAAINANEMRSFIGMAPYEGGDVYQSNANAVTMAQVNAAAEDTKI